MGIILKSHGVMVADLALIASLDVVAPGNRPVTRIALL